MTGLCRNRRVLRSRVRRPAYPTISSRQEAFPFLPTGTQTSTLALLTGRSVTVNVVPPRPSHGIDHGKEPQIEIRGLFDREAAQIQAVGIHHTQTAVS